MAQKLRIVRFRENVIAIGFTETMAEVKTKLASKLSVESFASKAELETKYPGWGDHADKLKGMLD